MHSKLSRVAVIDVGSNTIKSLVAQAGEPVIPLDRCHYETRISSGISQEHPRLSRTGMRAGLENIATLVDRVSAFHPDQIVITATSAVRDAENRNDFIDLVFNKTGIRMNVLTGKEEAILVVKGLTQDPSLRDRASFYQVDLGGGSMELIHYTNEKLDSAISLNLGAVRLTEKFIFEKNSPVPQETKVSISRYIRKKINESSFPFPALDGPLVGTGGAMNVVRNILAIDAGKTFEFFRNTFSKDDFISLYQRIAQIPLDERLKIPGLPQQRADILPCALLTLLEVINAAETDEINHSLYNLRFGVAADLLSQSCQNPIEILG